MPPVSVDEFRQRYAGRYFGKFRGIVTAVVGVEEGEDKFFQIKSIVPVVLGPEEELGWAWPKGGGVKTGFCWAPQVNDNVWIEFEEGDVQRPIWEKGPWGKRDDESMVPLHALGEEDDVDNQIRDTGILPPSSFAGEYPDVRIIQSVKKHFIEFDDTPGHTRVQLAHKDGSRLEMLHDGSVEIVTKDELRQYVSEVFKLEIMKIMEVLIHEALNVEVDQGISVTGNQDISIEASTNIVVEAGTDMSLKSAGGELTLNTSPVPGIGLGGAGAVEPFIMGTQWQTLMANILVTLSTHTHATGVGPSAPPTEFAAILAYIPQLVNSLSQYIKGK